MCEERKINRFKFESWQHIHVQADIATISVSTVNKFYPAVLTEAWIKPSLIF